MAAPSSQSEKLIGGGFGRESHHREEGVLHRNHMGGGPVAIDCRGAENDAALFGLLPVLGPVLSKIWHGRVRLF